jgi:hypothetical protein
MMLMRRMRVRQAGGGRESLVKSGVTYQALAAEGF